MCLFGSPRQRGRGRQLLCAALLLLLVGTPAPADVIVAGSGSTTSSAFTDFGGSSSQTNSFSGLGSRTSSASASVGGIFSGSASSAGSVSIGLSGPPNGVQTFSGSASSSGISTGSSEALGSSTLSGTLTLTPAGGVNTEYGYQLTASGAASQTFFNDASAGFNISGVGGNSVTALDFLDSNTQTFSMTGSGILVPGVFPFSAFANQDTFENGSFTGVTSGSVNFSLLLTPIPEPGTVAALGLGVLSLASYGWLRRRRVAPI
jgi:hypothetical protein